MRLLRLFILFFLVRSTAHAQLYSSWQLHPLKNLDLDISINKILLDTTVDDNYPLFDNQKVSSSDLLQATGRNGKLNNSQYTLTVYDSFDITYNQFALKVFLGEYSSNLSEFSDPVLLLYCREYGLLMKSYLIECRAVYYFINERRGQQQPCRRCLTQEESAAIRERLLEMFKPL